MSLPCNMEILDNKQTVCKDHTGSFNWKQDDYVKTPRRQEGGNEIGQSAF